MVDFDHHSREYAANTAAIYADLRRRAPVAWTDSHGGFWIVSGRDEVRAVAQDAATFSAHHDVSSDAPSYSGIGIPPVSPVRLVPQELDPPELLDYRRVLNPLFSPAAIERLRPMFQRVSTWCIDQCIETGTIDLVHDLAHKVSVTVGMQWLGLPSAYWHDAAESLLRISHTPSHSPEYPALMDAAAGVVAAFADTVAERRRHPSDDVISYLVAARLNDDGPIPDEELPRLLLILLGAATDTTTSLLSAAFDHLDAPPDERRRLIADPSLMRSACEELLRFYSPAMVSARTATRDVVLGGQLIRRGERVLVSFWSANHDERVFERADTVVLDRTPNPHAGFGLGAHRCLGSHFARALFEVVVGDVLVRMPDYEIDRSRMRSYEFTPMHVGYEAMPARFTPGQRWGSEVLDLDGSALES